MKSKLLLAILVVFVSGIIIGYVGGKYMMHYRVGKMLKGGPDFLEQHLIEQLTERLELTPEQIPAVRKKINEGIANMDVLRRNQHMEFKQQVNENIQDIAPLLTAEQQKCLEKITPEDLRPRGIPQIPPPPPPPPPKEREAHTPLPARDR